MTLFNSRSFSLAAAWLLPLAAAHADIRLTDITLFSADSQGNWIHQTINETRPGGNFNLWIQNISAGGVFLNGPTDAQAQPNALLSSGTTTLNLYGDPGNGGSWFGINLFLNGSTTPSISVFAPLMTSTSEPVFLVDNSSDTAVVMGNGLLKDAPAAGTLSATIGNQIITLTDFYNAQPSVYNQDKAGQITLGADGTADYVGGITLTITTVPEPSSLCLLALMAPLLFGCCKRRNTPSNS